MVMSSMISARCVFYHFVRRSSSAAAYVFTTARLKLVHKLIHYGVKDRRVIDAMKTIPRHEFLSVEAADYAYLDKPLTIGHEQSASQPALIAFMCQDAQIKPSDVVLEIGTGCGYSAAVLSQLARTVYSVEIIPQLHETAVQNIQKQGYENVHLFHSSNGKLSDEWGLFDVIMSTVSVESIPPELTDRLRIGGRIIIPKRCKHNSGSSNLGGNNSANSGSGGDNSSNNQHNNSMNRVVLRPPDKLMRCIKLPDGSLSDEECLLEGDFDEMVLPGGM